MCDNREESKIKLHEVGECDNEIRGENTSN